MREQCAVAVCKLYLKFTHRLIKLSSPNLNYLIGTGAIILYIATFLLVTPSKDPLTVSALCTSINWLLSIGFSLCYGTIICKMIRIHYIFKNPVPQPRAVSVVVKQLHNYAHVFKDSEVPQTILWSFYFVIIYIPPTIQFVLGKGCFKCYKIPPMGKNAIKSPLEGKMLIKSLPQAILAKFESVSRFLAGKICFASCLAS